MKKKAQSVTLGRLPSIALIFVLIGMIVGAGSITMDAFKETQCGNAGYFWNATNNACTNTTGMVKGDYAVNATSDGLLALSNLSDQLPTIGTIVGVVAIIVVVVGGFAVFLNRRGSI